MKKILTVFFTIGLLFCFVGCGEKGPITPITKDFDYDIDSKWMNRVKQIVDWAYEEDMYVIMNIHHDNCTKDNFKKTIGFYPSEECKDESIKYITRVWEQVSETFKDYDEKLVFEILNEPRLQDAGEHEWNYNSSCSTCKDAMNSLNEFNQNALDTIRASGGNNSTRLVMIPSIAASPNAAFNSDFKLPEDSAENALALSVHMYTPYNFAMAAPGDSVFTNSHKKDLDWHFSELNKLYVSKGIPVIIGEMGATNKDNLQEREKWFDYFNNGARKYGMTACVWDNGSANPSKTEDERYGYYNRTKQEWYFPSLMEKSIIASKNSSFTPKNKAQEIVFNMQFGWNLGNTLDATASSQNAGLSTEIGWGQPKTTQAMIKGLKALGINTIRIPISWHNHISK